MAAHRYWRLKVRTSPTAGDPNWSTIASLLHLDGADGSTTFTDEIGSTWTGGSGAVISTAQSKFGGASFTGGELTTTSYNGTCAGNFTVEFWCYTTVTSNFFFTFTIGSEATGRFIAFPNSQRLFVDKYAAFSQYLGSETISTNTWTHIAYVRSGGVIKGYLNGVACSTPYSDGTSFGNSANVRFSAAAGVHIEEFLFDKSVARYTANFTPPAAPYVLPLVAVGELQMRTAISGSNVVSGGTVSASSSFGAYTAAKAVDGLTTDTGAGNAWRGAYPGWLAYDFGAGNEKAIQEIVIYAPGTGGIAATELPTGWDIEWSDDNTNWLKQASYDFDVGTTAWGLSESRVYDVRKPVPSHSQTLFDRLSSHIFTAPGEPTAPSYDPGSEAGKMRVNDRTRFGADNTHGGMYKLAGTTTVLTNPAARRVRLYHQFDGRLYAEQYTAPDGLFEFRNIEIGPWVVVGVDDTGTYNGVIYTNVNAVPM